MSSMELLYIYTAVKKGIPGTDVISEMRKVYDGLRKITTHIKARKNLSQLRVVG